MCCIFSHQTLLWKSNGTILVSSSSSISNHSNYITAEKPTSFQGKCTQNNWKKQREIQNTYFSWEDNPKHHKYKLSKSLWQPEENKLTTYHGLTAFRQENFSHQIQTLQSLHKSMTSPLVTHCLQYLYSAGCLPRGKVSALLRPITHSDPCTGDKEDVLSPCLNFTHSAWYPSRISFLNFMTMLNRALSAVKLQLVLSREQHREEHMCACMCSCAWHESSL